MTNTRGTYSDRYAALVEQQNYARRVAAFGLPALLAPYTVRGPIIRLPRQRGTR